MITPCSRVQPKPRIAWGLRLDKLAHNNLAWGISAALEGSNIKPRSFPREFWFNAHKMSNEIVEEGHVAAGMEQNENRSTLYKIWTDSWFQIILISFICFCCPGVSC